ncbi:MAG: hypothetical protein KAQ98_10050 [Bacteriovoracaceae bacterium]|nr:hypothetical protein [Bacteriovoracaceae bacterium]
MSKLAFYLEDDELMRMAMEKDAKRRKLNFKTFSNPENFFKAVNKTSKDTILFLDSNIGEGISGEEIGKICFENGFENIFLITNSDKKDFPPMPWIKDIGGKLDIFKFWNTLQ